MPHELFETGSAAETEAIAGYAEIVPERGLDRAGGLTYAVPERLADLRVGERVTVPLGRGDTPTGGLVIARLPAPESTDRRIKGVLARAEGGLTQPLVQLARWIASYYCCPLGMVLATMTPAAVKRGERRRTRLLVEPAEPAPDDQPALTPTARAAWDRVRALESGRFPIEPKTLAGLVEAKTVAPINRLIDAGLLVARTEVKAASDPLAFADASPNARTPPALTRAQRDAIEAVSQTTGSFAAFLLLGVTGSGKTEVYLSLVERAVSAGRSAIVLVPEIALTPQTVGRFATRLVGDVASRRRLAVLHSGLTASQRHAEWARVARGEVDVVVGARSAIFAPVEAGRPLGIIIVDEEHDGSYKQDQLPRYHARDLAIKRGQLETCPVVLGSATPSLESWHNATAPRAPGGRPTFRLIELPERVAGGALPPVRVVDLNAERRARADRSRQHALGPTLEAALVRTLEAGDQAILLLNRRGYASHIACADPACGYVQHCDHCDAASVYHRQSITPGGVVRCHHCLAETKLPAACPRCGGRLTLFNAGTQKLEQELAQKLELVSAEASTTATGGLRMLRLDSDTMRSARDYFNALERFRRGDVRVLLGTQMLAKGLDFPGVTLIGVVNADTALQIDDFRSGERTFQLIAQVAGRAGRSEASADRASVIVQALEPDHPAIRCAATHDYRGFAEVELAHRARFGLPPIGRMARIVLRDRDAAASRARADRIREALDGAGVEGLRVVGPMPAAIARIADHHRVELRLHAASPAPIQRALTALRNASLAHADAHTAIDVDPIALL